MGGSPKEDMNICFTLTSIPENVTNKYSDKNGKVATYCDITADDTLRT